MLRFWYRLALVMHIPVGELQQRMSHSEFLHWRAYYRRETFGDTRSDLQAAQQLALTANVNRKKSAKRATVDDFMPDYWGEKQRNLGARIERSLKAAEAHVKRT